MKILKLLKHLSKDDISHVGNILKRKNSKGSLYKLFKALKELAKKIKTAKEAKEALKANIELAKKIKAAKEANIDMEADKEAIEVLKTKLAKLIKKCQKLDSNQDEQLYCKVFSKRADDDDVKTKTIQNLKTELVATINEYLISTEMDEYLKTELLAKAYAKRHLKKELKKILNASNDKLQAIERKRPETFLRIANLNDILSYNNIGQDERLTNLENVECNLNKYFYFFKTNVNLSEMNYLELRNFKYDFPKYKKVIAHGNSFGLMENYQYASLTLATFQNKDGIANYTNFYNKIINEEALEKLTKTEINSFCRILINKGIHWYQGDKETYRDLFFTIYDFRYKHNLYLEDGKITFTDFLNTIAAAINSKKFLWAEEFITELRPHISPAVKAENAIQLAKAEIYFARNKFETVYDLLKNMASLDKGLEIRNRQLRIRSLLERAVHTKGEEYSIVSNELNNFRSWLDRHEEFIWAESYIQFCLRGLELYKQKNQIRQNESERNRFLEKIRIDYINENELKFRNWFIDIVERMKNQPPPQEE